MTRCLNCSQSFTPDRLRSYCTRTCASAFIRAFPGHTLRNPAASPARELINA